MKILFLPFLQVSSATLLSRFFGFMRDILMASLLGAGGIADAFFVAFRLPNLFRHLLADGAFTAAFVPLFIKKSTLSSEEDALVFAGHVASWMLLFLALITLLAEIFMPVLVFLLAPGFSSEPEKFQMAVDFSRITFPYLGCISLMAIIGGILNAKRRFLTAAFMPVLLNLMMISALLISYFYLPQQSWFTGLFLSISVLFSGFLQLFCLFWVFSRMGLSLCFCRPYWHCSIKELLWRALPGVIAGGGVQINAMIGTIISSLQGGAVSYLYYADRLYHLPVGVIGVGISVVLLPLLSAHWQDGTHQAALGTQNRAIELALSLTLPAACALFLIPEEIVRTLFEHGSFDAADTQATADALKLYALALPAFVLNKIFSPAFFARDDTKTPMRFSLISIAANIVLCVTLFPIIGYLSVALATSFSAWLTTFLLVRSLKQKGHFATDALLWRRLSRLFLITVFLGGVIYTSAKFLDPFLSAPGSLERIFGLSGVIGISLMVFFCLVFTSGLFRFRKSA